MNRIWETGIYCFNIRINIVLQIGYVIDIISRRYHQVHRRTVKRQPKIFLHLTGTAARITDRPEQTGLCERYHLVYYIDRASRLFYYRHVQPHTTTHDRHIAYRRRHI